MNRDLHHLVRYSMLLLAINTIGCSGDDDTSDTATTTTGDGDGDDGAGGEGGATDSTAGDTGEPVEDPELDLGIEGATWTFLDGLPQAMQWFDGRIFIAGVKDADFWLSVHEEGGELAATFGDAGTATHAFSTTGEGLLLHDVDVAYGLEVTSDHILVAGAAQGMVAGSDSRWGVVRFTPDGQLDEDFGEQGEAVLDWTISSKAFQVRSTEDGKIYVAGSIDNPTTDAAIVRLDEDGGVDNTFSSAASGAGIVLDNDGYEYGLCFDASEDGLVISGGSDFSLARVTSDADLDTSFGSDGWSEAVAGQLHTMTRLADGKLLLAGTEPSNEDSRIEALLLVRLLADGSLDESFGDGGVARLTYDFGSYTWPELEEAVAWEDAFVWINGMAPLDDGGVLLYADALGFLVRYPLLLRVTADGELDTSFGQDGVVAVPLAIPLFAGALMSPSARLVAHGNTAWLSDEFVFEEGNRGLLIRLDLDQLEND